MAGVMPKVKLYTFLSIIVLLVNLSLFSTSLIASPNSDINSLFGEESEETYKEGDLLGNEGETNIGNFVLSTGSSFIPFVSLIPLVLSDALPIEMTVFTGFVLGIISVFQVFLLLVIVMNLVPKILGSGFDV